MCLAEGLINDLLEERRAQPTVIILEKNMSLIMISNRRGSMTEPRNSISHPLPG